MISRALGHNSGDGPRDERPASCCLCNLLLGQPIGGENALPRSHLGLLHIATYVRQFGLRVDVIDADAEFLPDSEVRRLILESQPRLLGLAATKATIHRVLSLAEMVGEQLPHTLIVLGGEQAALTAAQVLNEAPAIDAVVLGEGEGPFLQLARQALRGGAIRYGEVSGIAFRDVGDQRDASRIWSRSRCWQTTRRL